MPKTTNLGLHMLASAGDFVEEFVNAMIEGDSTSPSDPQKIDNAIQNLEDSKQKKLVAGKGITIDEETGEISISFADAEEGEY